MSRRKVGKVRQKLAKVLKDQLGITVAPEDLWTQEGFYRNWNHDLARWGCSHAIMADGSTTAIASWDTMTDCARYGVDSFVDGSWYTEICQRDPKHPEKYE